jgi:hypothetical protein
MPNGVDVSQAMPEQAEKPGVNRERIHADIGACLKKAEASGFRVDRIFSMPIRHDQAQPLAGMDVYLS